MATAYLPKTCHMEGLLSAMDEAGVLKETWGSLVVEVPTDGFIACEAMAFLTAWGMAQRAAGRRLHLRGDAKALGYLSRMGLHEHWGIAFTEGQRQDETGRFLPLKAIRGEEDVHAAVDALCDLVLHQFDDAVAFLPALEWAAYEIVDNIVIHAESQTPGVVCAQYFPARHHLDIAIVDLGRGLKASLETTRTVAHHGEAVSLALLRGVTRDKEVGQGNGMAGAQEIARRNGGQLRLWTGDMLYQVEGDKAGEFRQIPSVTGTGVAFTLDTRRAVSLADTWIAHSDWTFLNAEAERVAEAGGLDVAAACVNTGSRPPAQRLRRKIMALLTEMQGVLALDFSKVRRASSSFLDELLGRMALELGEGGFQRRISVVGMTSEVRGVANVVIQQRLHGLPEIEAPADP